MPRKKRSGLSKKEIRRFKKSDLISRMKDKGASKKMSKNALVDMFFKDKILRINTQAPAKRSLTAKQKANLEKFKIQKNFKNETTVKQAPQFVAELRKLEHTGTKVGKDVPDEFQKKKIGEGKGMLFETQIEKLKQQAGSNKQVEKTRGLELSRSINKTSDTLDRAVDEEHRKKEEPRTQAAIHHAKSSKDVRFGQEDNTAINDAGKDTVFGLMNTPIQDLVSRVKRLKDKNPDDPLVVIISQLLQKKKGNR